MIQRDQERGRGWGGSHGGVEELSHQRVRLVVDVLIRARQLRVVPPERTPATGPPPLTASLTFISRQR